MAKRNIVADDWTPFFLLPYEDVDWRTSYEIPDDLIEEYISTLEKMNDIQIKLERIYREQN